MNMRLQARCTKHRRAHCRLTTIAITLAALPALGSSTFAQGEKTPFTSDQARLFLQDAAEKARIQARKVAKTFDDFKKTVAKEPFEGGKYIVNGDTPVSTDDQLEDFYKQNVAASPQLGPEFAVFHKDGKDIIWGAAEKKALTYCVSNAPADAGGFGNRYDAVVSAMADAAKAWEAVADIHYIHVIQEDANCNAANEKVMFDVRPVNINTYLARSFFPNDARPQRNVLIDNSSFELPIGGKLSLTGVLRHELGHTLGARHEQTRPQAGTCFEDNDWRGVTDYDALSVMHYPQCNGKGDWSLTLTSLDKNGIACLYKAAPGFTIDPNICKAKQ